MLEQYPGFLASHKLAVGLFIAQLALRPLVRHYDLKPDEEDLAGWVRRYKHLPNVLKGAVDGVLLTVNSALGEWYLESVALPRLTGEPLSQLFGVVMIFIGAGIGLSIGKAVTERDYNWFQE